MARFVLIHRALLKKRVLESPKISVILATVLGMLIFAFAILIFMQFLVGDFTGQ